MNCGMNQPPCSGVTDLYIVSLETKEHKVVFTKDLLKFYQCAELDEALKHAHRVLWRFGETS
jgi:hypothetical protein